MASKLITDAFPKVKKGRPINRKEQQTKPSDITKNDAGVPQDQTSDLSQDLSVLKEFDLDNEFGPCIGITRLQRWERAKEYGLYPPENVKTIILKHPNDANFTECIWYDANL